MTVTRELQELGRTLRVLSPEAKAIVEKAMQSMADNPDALADELTYQWQVRETANHQHLPITKETK